MDGKKLTQKTQIPDVSFFLGDSEYMGLIQNSEPSYTPEN